MAIFGFTRVQPDAATKLDRAATNLRNEQAREADSARFLIDQARQAEAASQEAAAKASAVEKAYGIRTHADAEVARILDEAGVTV